MKLAFTAFIFNFKKSSLANLKFSINLSYSFDKLILDTVLLSVLIVTIIPLSIIFLIGWFLY